MVIFDNKNQKPHSAKLNCTIIQKLMSLCDTYLQSERIVLRNASNLVQAVQEAFLEAESVGVKVSHKHQI